MLYTGFAKGDSVEYYSASYGDWIPCEVIEADPRRGVQINVKPGAWLNADFARDHLRKPGGGKGSGDANW